MIDLAEALATNFDEVHYTDFYRSIFPAGELEEKISDYGEYEKGKYHGIALSVGTGGNRTKHYIVTDDLQAIDNLTLTDDFCIASPISYIGRSRKSQNARFMYAMAIDLDGVETKKQWDFFMTQIEEGHKMLSFVWGLPKPTYLVSSGTGLHIYYVFEKPIPLFSNIVKQLETLKRRLTWQAWTQGASSLHDKVQYESLFQAFRVVGTITKTGSRCRAFKVGNKVDIDYLNAFVPEQYRVTEFTYKSELRLEDAKKKYPKWYQERVVQGRPKNTWTCKKDLYDWWIRKLSEGAEQGHRYWCIMTLATYAKKCAVDRETLENDAYGLIPLMNTKGDLFTEDDVLHALAAYTDSYITYPIHTIVSRTGIPIEKNKRNGRKQAVHLARARAVQNIDFPNHEWAGRPSKEEMVRMWQFQHEGTKNDCVKYTGLSWPTVSKYWFLNDVPANVKVEQWQEKHPDGRKADCIRDTGLSKPTVYKYWK